MRFCLTGCLFTWGPRCIVDGRAGRGHQAVIWSKCLDGGCGVHVNRGVGLPALAGALCLGYPIPSWERGITPGCWEDEGTCMPTMYGMRLGEGKNRGRGMTLRWGSQVLVIAVFVKASHSSTERNGIGLAGRLSQTASLPNIFGVAGLNLGPIQCIFAPVLVRFPLCTPMSAYSTSTCVQMYCVKDYCPMQFIVCLRPLTSCYMVSNGKNPT